ncbi:MAG: 2,5-diamino-6-(ribosylamino)-4(3H)-pyrimidinone 5'-phosphate reductase [Methanoregulaceae archaeon]
MRPWVIVNAAMSADGKLSTRERRQVKISGQDDFIRVDRLKASCDAVMVGIGTILADDPSLTVKSPDLIQGRTESGKDEHPVRIVVDSSARIPVVASILRKGTGKRIVAVGSRAPEDKIRELESLATVIRTSGDAVDLPALVSALGEMGIKRLMVEGGGTLIWSLFRSGLVDEVSVFVGNCIIGGKDAPTLSDGEGFIRESDFVRLSLAGAEKLGEGILLRWEVKK